MHTQRNAFKMHTQRNAFKMHTQRNAFKMHTQRNAFKMHTQRNAFKMHTQRNAFKMHTQRNAFKTKKRLKRRHKQIEFNHITLVITNRDFYFVEAQIFTTTRPRCALRGAPRCKVAVFDNPHYLSGKPRQ